MYKRLFSLLLLLIIGKVYATHNRAGEITYEHVSGLTYRITLTTYTYSKSKAYRCEQEIFFGDGESAKVQRSNGPNGSNCGSLGIYDSSVPAGELLANDIIKNVYVVNHTYPGAGSYLISLNDPDRNDGICNIANETPFYVQSELIINPFLGSNNSPVLLNPPIDQACVGECFEHNPGANDVDGDSLVYSLVASYADGIPIINYFLPPNLEYNDIDALKGDLVWCVPIAACEYNIAILIKEYRRLPGSSERFYIGSVLRDLQIDVRTGCNNDPPQIANLNDTCIEAGSNLNFGVTATDANANIITLTATGGPFQLNPPASFSSTPLTSTTTGIFNWNPNCDQVQLLPYLVTFKAQDSHPSDLVDFESIFIRVIAPAPKNVSATPSGASIILNWNDALCNSTLGDNPLINYAVYRKDACDGWAHAVCETGVPPSAGYTLVGTTNADITTFTDNNNGVGLNNGIDYSYLIVANYIDGSQSYASTPVCQKLIRDVPIITNVSVLSTGSGDSIWVHWTPPLGDAANFDTIANPGVYEVRVMQAFGTNPNGDSYSQIRSYTYPAFWQMNDTGIIATNLNTNDSAYTYKIEFYANGSLVGTSNKSSSVYLTTSPTDNKINLSWDFHVPWANYKYFVYKDSVAGSGVYKLLDSTINTNYSDDSLVNGRTYCYKIVAYGSYSDTSIASPLINYSQISCNIPVDIIPPCQPTITSINNDCVTELNTITWSNPDNYCSDDVMKYNIYYSPNKEDDLFLIGSISDETDTTFKHTYLFGGTIPSIAGCYAISAIDSTGNESTYTVTTCVDNCPIYELPNVFTPNTDGTNDLYIPLTPYRYVKDIDIKIYNRWGNLVFTTTEPSINWNGKDMNTDKPCPDGVYFYICTINEIRVGGILPREEKGFIHLIRD